MSSTTLRRLRQIVGVFAYLTGSVAEAQLTPRDIHDRIAEYFRAVPAGVMPPGDTLVTWRADGPILYHTAQRSGDTVRAGMFRNDALIGAETVRWDTAGPSRFSVRWLGTSSLQLDGRVEGKQIVVTGSRRSRSTVPAGLWAVADYGMDDLLLPLVSRLRASTQSVSVFRPFSNKWDTLTVSVTVLNDVRVLNLVDAKGQRTECATDVRQQSCLWIQESSSSTERRPLEGTAAFESYSVVRRAIGRLP